MDEVTLRARVAKKVGVKTIRDDIWEKVNQDSFVADALDLTYKSGFKILCKEIESLLCIARNGRKRPPGRSQPRVLTPELAAIEKERAEAVSLYVAKQAATTSAVRRFRRNLFQGTVLSHEQALAFLTSPASSILAYEQFQALSIPLAGHCAQVIGTPTMLRSVEKAPGGDTVHYIRQATLQIEWSEGAIEETFKDEFLSRHPPKPPLPVNFLDLAGKSQRLVPWPGAIVSKVGKLSRLLAKRYPWSEAQATMFALTDKAPFMAPLLLSWQENPYAVCDPDCPMDEQGNELDTDCQGVPPQCKHNWGLALTRPQITLTVEPWVSDKTVLQAYRAAQRAILKQDNHKRTPQALALFRFITDKMEKGDWHTQTWDKLMTAWERAQTDEEWKYGNVRNFREAIDRTRRGLLFPDIPLPRRQGRQWTRKNAP